MVNKQEDSTMMDHKEILMNETDLLKGLLEAASFKDDKEMQRLVQIKRKGKVLFSFHIRPLEEEESDECRRKATKKVANPNGRHLPKIEGTTDYVKMRSYKILAATIEEDRAKIWDNPKIKEQLNVLQAIDVIDMVLMAGEKDQICDIIDDISQYGVSLEDFAKN